MVHKKAWFAVILALIFFTGKHATLAQVEQRKFEASLVVTAINLRTFDSVEPGGGIRFSYNINPFIAVEAEGNLFDFRIGDHPTDDKLGAQGLIGIKAGYRTRRVGVFAKVRPGVVNFPDLRVRQRNCFIGETCLDTGRSGNRLAIDVGGVLEIYPTENLVVRFDVGDTMIRFSGDLITRFPTPVAIPDRISHNAQWSGSVGIRF